MTNQLTNNLGRLEPMAGATPWFLSGGINPADCVAAYQAIGAESYAASKVNLANPGTYDLTDGVAPSWNAETGWTFDGLNQYLFAGAYPHSNVPFTVIVRAKFIISHNDTSAIFSLTRNLAGPWTGWAFKAEQWNNTGKVGFTSFGVADNTNAFDTPLTDAVIAVTRNGTTITYYVDGAVDAKTVTVNINSISLGFYIGITYQPHNTGAPVQDLLKGEIYALAYYHAALTSAQIAAVSAAMNGNEPEPQTNIPVFMAYYARLRNA